MEKTRDKNDVINDYRESCAPEAIVGFQDLLLEVLIDIRDELAGIRREKISVEITNDKLNALVNIKS